MFAFSKIQEIEIWALWSKDELGNHVHCQVMTPGDAATPRPDPLPAGPCGVIIGMNPGDLALTATQAESLTTKPVWLPSIPATTHSHILKQLPKLNDRLSPRPATVPHIVILNPLTIVDPSPSSAKSKLAGIPIKQQIARAKSELAKLDELKCVQWVWCAWSADLPHSIAKEVYEWMCAWTAKARAPVFYVRQELGPPWVCHINTGLEKGGRQIGEVCILPASNPPVAGSRKQRKPKQCVDTQG